MNYKLLHNIHQFDTTIQLISIESRLILDENYKRM